MMSAHVLVDTKILTGRSPRHIARSPDTIITTAVTPIAMMPLFVYVFGGAITTGSGGPYVDYLLPGILLITIASGIAYTAYRLFLDLQSGILERFQSMPIARPSVLWAHVLTSLVANLVSVAVVFGVALIVGFRTAASLGAWLAVIGVLILFILALTWIAVIAGLSAKTVDGASAFSYPLIFLPFISSAFVPTESMPGPVAWFAEHQPVTAIVDALRSVFAGGPFGNGIWVAVAWLVGLVLISYATATAMQRRKLNPTRCIKAPTIRSARTTVPRRAGRRRHSACYASSSALSPRRSGSRTGSSSTSWRSGASVGSAVST